MERLERMSMMHMIRYMTLQEIADFYEVQLSCVSKLVTRQMQALRRGVDVNKKVLIKDTVGKWMDSEERKYYNDVGKYKRIKYG